MRFGVRDEEEGAKVKRKLLSSSPMESEEKEENIKGR